MELALSKPSPDVLTQYTYPEKSMILFEYWLVVHGVVVCSGHVRANSPGSARAQVRLKYTEIVAANGPENVHVSVKEIATHIQTIIPFYDEYKEVRL